MTAYLVAPRRVRHLYEVVAEEVQRNFGRAGGLIHTLIVRDCVTEEVCTISGRALAECVPLGTEELEAA